MIDYLWIWSEMLIRWVHVIAGIAWIGSSFYFIALDLSLKPGKQLPDEAHGQTWQVHGGGFYNMVKYLVAPKRMPDELSAEATRSQEKGSGRCRLATTGRERGR